MDAAYAQDRQIEIKLAYWRFISGHFTWKRPSIGEFRAYFLNRETNCLRNFDTFGDTTAMQ